MNVFLKGRAVVFVTNFSDYLEYFNGAQNRIVGLTGIDLNGEYLAQDEKGLFPDNVTYEEIYSYNKEDDEEERE